MLLIYITNALVSFANSSIFCFISDCNSVYLIKSVFVKIITKGFDWNKGLILLNKEIYYSIVYPHVSEISIKYKTLAFKWAKAVIACISIVFLSSNGWSKIPGVSIT